MSCVHLIAADKELPLCMVDLPCTVYREVNVRGRIYRGETTSIPCFAVQEHTYYKWAVDELGLKMKPYQYEMDWHHAPESMEHLRDYLSKNFSSGETVELWSLWVGDRPEKIIHCKSSFQDLNLDTMSVFRSNTLGQNCITVKM